MTLEEALNEKCHHYHTVRATVITPNSEKAGWVPNDPDVAFWHVDLEHSDGQYGGGHSRASAKTLSEALIVAVRQFHDGIEKMYGPHK